MNFKRIITISGVIFSLLLTSVPIKPVCAETEVDYVGEIPSDLLGTASAFSVFTKEARFNGSDTEGRVAVQIGTNKGQARYYSVATSPLPSVIVGNEEDGYLEGFD